MGWKTSSIIISPQVNIDDVKLLEIFGFSGLNKIEEEPYDQAIYPETGNIYVGNYKNCTIISEETLPEFFINDYVSDLEQKICESFPDSEICAVWLISSMNHWGYSITKNGEKLRARLGDGDNGTLLDFGTPVPEENELLSKSQIDSKGRRLYTFERWPDEKLTEDQVGENFVFEIYKRYTGISMDSDDELLETMFRGYTINNSTEIEKPKIKANGSTDKPWWKLW